MTPGPGRFVVVEGPDGAGKSTLVAALAERLRAAGEEPVLVREPGGTPAAEALRRELLDAPRRFEPLTELLYITAARADLVHHVIRPALESGRTVVSDRYDLSTAAYQGAGRGVDPATVALFNRAATGGLQPDLVLVLDVPAGIGTERQVASGRHRNRLDLEDAGFHQRVVAHYLAATGPMVRHLDGTLPAAQVSEAAWEVICRNWPGVFRRTVPQAHP